MRALSLFRLPAFVWLSMWFSAPAPAEDAIEEIVVTADFQQRPASEIPVSVSVLDGSQIRDLAVQHFEELIGSIPNLNWSGDGNRARYFQIRGVGELEQYQGAPNPSVGFVVDDIDFSGIGTMATLFDIDRVEVLRGPQGTRYGASALAGLIYMRSAVPTADFEGHAELSLGGDDTQAGGIAFGGPLSDSSAYRFSVHRHLSDGFRHNAWLGRNDTNGRDETTVRGRLHWSAARDWKFQLASVYVDIDDGYDAFALDNGYTTLSDKPGKDAQRSIGASLRAGYSGWPNAQLTSITSYADSDIHFDFDADWGNSDSWAPVTYDYVSLNGRSRGTFAQELRLSGDRWLVGAYGLRLEDRLHTLNQGDYYDPGSGWADSLFDDFDSRYVATSLAAFGQYELAASEYTHLDIGLRGEHRDTDYRDSAGLQSGPKDAGWGGELSLSHDHSGDVTSYLGLSKGYKAGGFNLGTVPDGYRDFAAEALWSLEAGIKSDWAGGRLRLDASVFASRRTDQQVRTSFQLVPGDPASFVFLTVNADRGKSRGLEADLNWLASDRWMFYANLGLLRTSFERFDQRPDLEGRDQAHAPHYTLAAGGRYSHPGGFFARVDISARDRFYFDVSNDQQSRPCRIVNARAGYEAGDWSAVLWVRNLTAEKYAVRGFYFGNEPPDFPDTLYVRLGDPRQSGLTIQKRF